MLNDVGSGGGIEIPMGRYLIQMAEPLEEAEPGQYGARVKWQFHVWECDNAGNAGALVTTDEYGPWWQWTSTKMGEKATARKWLEALHARSFEKGESGEELADAAVGKYAFAMIGENENGYTTILKMSPYKAPAAAPAPAPAPAAAPAAPAPATPPAAPAFPPGGAPSADDLPFE